MPSHASYSQVDFLFTRYLLDDCSDDERRQVEEQFFASDGSFERLCELEEDLIERYAAGELSSDERARFERAYASSPRRDRVLFSRALQTLTSRAASVEAVPQTAADASAGRGWLSWLRLDSPALRFSLVAASVVLLAGAVAVGVQNRRLTSSLAAARADADRLRQQQAADRQRLDELARRRPDLATQPTRPAPLLLSLVLSPGLLRSGDGPKRLLVPPSSAPDLRLQLDLESGVAAGSYRVDLRAGSGDVILSRDQRRSQPVDGGTAVVITVPAALLRAGDYEVELRESGRLEEAGHYYFSVVTR